MLSLFGLTLSSLVVLGLFAPSFQSQAAGTIGGSVTLKCPAEFNETEGDYIEWNDMVYNDHRDRPAVIYDSERGANSKHANADSMSVEDYELTIHNLKSSDIGEYSCQVIASDGIAQLSTFNLNIFGKVSCNGNGEVNENDPVILECTTEVYGAMPATIWKNRDGRLPEDKVKSKGLFGEPITLEASFKATYMDDGDNYTCIMSYMNIDELNEDTCHVPFVVRYAARDLKVDPEQEVYSPGDILTFSATGNPKPKTQLDPEGMENEDGTISLKITEEMLNDNHSVTFSAQNNLNKDPVTLVKSFLVKEPPTTTQAPTTSQTEEAGNVGTGGELTDNGDTGTSTRLSISTSLFILSSVIARMFRV